jgi:hypothetical protein
LEKKKRARKRTRAARCPDVPSLTPGRNGREARVARNERGPMPQMSKRQGLGESPNPGPQPLSGLSGGESAAECRSYVLLQPPGSRARLSCMSCPPCPPPFQLGVLTPWPAPRRTSSAACLHRVLRAEASACACAAECLRSAKVRGAVEAARVKVKPCACTCVRGREREHACEGEPMRACVSMRACACLRALVSVGVRALRARACVRA